MNLQIITREEIAEIYGVRPQTISDWASQGKFPKPLPGGNYRWSAKAVEHFMVLSSLPDEAVKKAKVLAGFGARSRGRTGTVSLPRDFKSLASTNFAIRATRAAS